jgi:hypothetical protein
MQNSLSLASALAVGAISLLVSQPARAASFGCSDNPNCQYYVQRGLNTGLGAQTVSETNYIPLLAGRFSSVPLGFNGTSSVSATANGNGYGSLAFATVTTGLELGQLKAKAFASAQSNATSPALNGPIAVAGASNRLGWGDLITVTSSTLATGTSVPFELRLNLDRTVSASGLVGGNTQASVYGSLRIGDPGYSDLGRVTIIDTNYYPSNVFTKTTIVYLSVGISTALEGELEVGASAESGGGLPTSDTSIADASHTANYYLAPLLEGVSYNSASGRSYIYSATPPTAVPEPTTILGTLVFLGAGYWLKCRRISMKPKATATQLILSTSNRPSPLHQVPPWMVLAALILSST